jgi:uncharacterized protein (DUF2147 family)
MKVVSDIPITSIYYGDSHMKKILTTPSSWLLILLLQMIAASASYAASPMGYWKTIDDVTGNVKSIVQIEGTSSDLTGKVVKLFPGALTTCSACNGDLKDKPILGMTIMHGLKQNPDNTNEWSSGQIMDPKSGKTYRCTIVVSPDASKLEVRGYIGVSILGRSQTWIKASKSE